MFDQEEYTPIALKAGLFCIACEDSEELFLPLTVIRKMTVPDVTYQDLPNGWTMWRGIGEFMYGEGPDDAVCLCPTCHQSRYGNLMSPAL